MFIAFDGIDGVGKSTQVQLLSQYLTSIDEPHQVLNLGGYDRFKNIIKKVNENSIETSAFIRELIYYFEGLYTNLDIIQPRREDSILIIDRYYLSYFAYGPLNGMTIEDISFFTKFLIEPDLYFYIDLLPEHSYERISKYRKLDAPEVGFDNYKKSETKKFEREAFIEFQTQVRNNYLQALKEGHIVLEGNKDPDYLNQLVIDKIQTNRSGLL